jgi:glycosyltransferase involved in cell wall biosynthesis
LANLIFEIKKELLNITVKKEELNPNDPIIVYHLPPTLRQYQNFKFKICFTMWETDKFPAAWVHDLNNFCDLVLIPSNFCKKVFIKSGVKTPIEVVQLGINLDNYKFISRPDHRDIFTFLSVGNMDERKNYRTALAAFYEEFTSDEPVRFIVKTRKGSPVNFLPRKNIEVIEKDYTAEELRDLYNQADCFVYPSRGEGFGLPPREAMATGLPVILTDYSALSDIADELISYPIKHYGLSKVIYPKSAVLGLGDDLGYWANPSKDEIKKLMREAYTNRRQAKAKGYMASVWMQEKADPKVGAKKIKDIIKLVKYSNKYGGQNVNGKS